MRICTLTVCFNAQTTIVHTVRSFLRQIHQDKEFLVIDGGPTDDTLEIMRAFDSPFIRIISEKDRGIYGAMNKGLRWRSHLDRAPKRDLPNKLSIFPNR